MNSLKSLKNIVSKLTEEEIKTLKKVLSINIVLKNESKSLNLINLLLSDKNYSFNEIQNNIYGKPNYNAFNKLLNRTKHKVLETIILDVTISSNNFSKRNKVNLDLRKKLLQADILQLKGIRKEVLPIYNYIISHSKYFELFDIQVSALVSKQRLQLINSKVNSFVKINDEIEYAESCHKALKTSSKIYNDIINKINNSINQSSYIDELKSLIVKLNEYYNIYRLPTIGFYLFTLEAEICENNLFYDKSKDALEKAKNILLLNESAYTENRYGTVLLNLSNCYIYLLKFDQAINLALESKRYFKNLPLTLKIVDEILFYAYFYKLDYVNCSKILSNNNYIKYDDDNLKNKFYYFQSCLFFINKKNIESLEALSNCSELKNDNEGWNINMRILLILNRIELNDYDSIDLKIQNLEKYIKRISNNKSSIQRQVLILRILTKLIQEDFNFKKVYTKRLKYFNILESKTGIYRWQIKSPELIIFNNWFKFKMNGSEKNDSLSN